MKLGQRTSELKDNKITRTDKPKQNLALGVTLMLLGGLGFSMMNLFIRLMGPDISSVQKMFFRNLFVFLITLIPLMRLPRGRRNPINNRSDLGYMLLRSVFGTLGMLANFIAVDLMPIANASVLNKLSPFFTILFAALFLRERVNKIQILGVIISFVGVIILSQPDTGGFTLAYLIPILIGVGGGLFAGAAYTSVRYLGSRGIKGAFIVTFFAGFSTLALLPYVLLNYTPMNAQQWFYAILIGLSAVLGQYGITYAYQYAEPRSISIFDYSTVVFTMILGMLFLGQIPGVYALIGSGIVFFAFFIMFIYNHIQAKKEMRLDAEAKALEAKEL